MPPMDPVAVVIIMTVSYICNLIKVCTFGIIDIPRIALVILRPIYG